MIRLEVEKYYLLDIKFNEKILTFTGKIVHADSVDFSFIDKFGNEKYYKKEMLMGATPIKNFEIIKKGGQNGD